MDFVSLTDRVKERKKRMTDSPDLIDSGPESSAELDPPQSNPVPRIHQPNVLRLSREPVIHCRYGPSRISIYYKS